MTSTTPTTTHPVVTAATGLMTVLWAAELRNLPLPMTARIIGSRITMQFCTAAEVDTWAAAMDVDRVRSEREIFTASGSLLDVPLTVCAYVPEVTA